MADTEPIGGVSVLISGDLGPLQAIAAPATALGAKIGAGVAQGFNTAASSANQFDAAIQALTTALAEQNAVLSLSIQRNMAHVAAVRAGSQAAHDGVTQIQATSGALRVLEGSGGIRAAERFLTMIPGLGAALQLAFPVIGAIALFDAFSRLAGKSEALTQAERELASATKSADDAFAHMENTLDSINVEHIKNIFGAAAGTGAEQSVIQQRIERAKKDRQDLVDSINEVAYAEAGAEKGGILTGNLKNLVPFVGNSGAVEKIKAIGQQIRDVDLQIQELQGQAGGKGEDKAREAAQQAGALAALQLKNAESAAQGSADQSKRSSQAKIEADHAAETARIDRLDSEFARVQQTGAEEIRYQKAKADDIAGYALATRDRLQAEIAARASAEASGKTKPEQAIIGATAQGDSANATREYQKVVQEGQIAVQKATEEAADKIAVANREEAKSWDEVTRAAYLAAVERRKALNESIGKRSEEALRGNLEIYKVGEAEAKGQGEIATAQAKATYEGQISHSIQQQVAYAQQLAAIQDAQYTGELTALAARLKEAGAISDEVEKAKQLRDLEAQIVALSGKAQAASATAAGSVAKAQSQGVGAQLGQIAESGLSSVSSAVAKGVFEGGKGLGKDLRESLKGIGEQLFSTLLKDSVDQLIIAITGQTIATNLNTIWLAIKSVIPFAEGTSSAPGGMALIGEKGPEIMYVPRGAQITPNHAITKYASGTPGYARLSASSASSVSIAAVHLYAGNHSNPRRLAEQMFDEIPKVAKARSPEFSPYSK